MPKACFIPGDFVQARAARDALESAARKLGDELRNFPRGPTGLAPDAVKFTPEYQAVARASATAFRQLQDFNKCFTSQFFRELQEARRRR